MAQAAGAIDLEYAGEGADARQTVPARGVRKSHQSKSIVFSAALFPRHVSLPHQPQVMQYLVLGVTHHQVVDIIVMIGYATLAQRISRMDQRAKADEGVEQSLWFTVYAGRGAARLRPPCLNQWNLARKERFAR